MATTESSAPGTARAPDRGPEHTPRVAGAVPARTGTALEWRIARRYLSSRRWRGFVSMITMIAIGGVAVGVMALIVVIGVMAGLQKDLREKILGASAHGIVLEVGQAYEQHAARALEQRQASGLSDLRNSGAEVRAIDESVRAEWARSLAPFPARMVADANARGMPGTEIIRAYIQEAERGGHQWPVAYDIN